MAEIKEYRLPDAIKNANTCKCKQGQRRKAVVTRKATAILDNEEKTEIPNERIALLFCSECGCYISKEPMTKEQYLAWEEERERKRKEHDKK